ncbi:GerMN domain-containing protein [bacterium]|nr:GerMN domain-containing protein [bacterium]
MNFSQRLGLFLLIVISVGYVYFSFFHGKEIYPSKPNQEESSAYNPLNQQNQYKEEEKSPETGMKNVKIFIVDKSGKIRSVNRACDKQSEKSCFEYAMKELVSGPTKWEKSAGFSSEIPQGTKVLSVRESAGNILVDLSSDFEAGGGTESTYYRIKQVIKTAKANTSSPVYLYINGRQANVIGGEGLMIKQPLSEDSLDD